MNLSRFTDEQLAVVNHPGGHALVSAVAGSGKTEVLVARAWHLLTQGVSSEDVLVLMFNKSAQEVFMQRLHALDSDRVEWPAVLTFHALGLRILDIWFDLQAQEFPTLVESEQQWLDLLAEVIKDLNTRQAGINTHKDYARTLLGALDLAKNLDWPHRSLTVEEAKSFGWTPTLFEHLHVVFPAFEAARARQQWLSLNDLLYDAVLLLRKEPSYAEQWRQSVQHILVDEYQDSNALQHWLLHTLMREDSSLMVVGDEDQCIYTWRAADPDMMVRGFEREYQGVTRYTLSKTFRYGHAVALMANHVLQHNRERPDKMVVSGLPKSGQVSIVEGTRYQSLGQGIGLLTEHDAVLVREFRHADDVEWVSRHLGIPYRLVGAVSFPNRTAGLALRAALMCALKLPITSSDMLRAWVRWVDPESPSAFVDDVAQSLLRCGVEPGIRKMMEKTHWTQRQQDHLVQLLVWNGRLEDVATQPDPVAGFVRRLRDAWARTVSSKNKDAWAEPAFLEVFPFCAGPDLSVILSNLNTWADETPGELGFLLTSIHRAKGGGWPTVLLPHVDKGRFPVEDATEEERRLYYVAMTRAKEHLIFVCTVDASCRQYWLTRGAMAMPPRPLSSCGDFLVESFPWYCQDIANKWMSTQGPLTEDLTPIARKYQSVLYPTVSRTRMAWDKLRL